jgi:beta-lactamase superfamily II metal-dependent hydrolase
VRYEIDFMPVGESHGDAICMRYWLPDNKFAVDVIDGGYASTGEDVVRHLANVYDTSHINNLVLTHSDQDHAAGLIPIMESCTVDFLYMNLPWLYVDYVQHLYNANYHRENLVRDIKDANKHLVDILELADSSKHTRVLPVFQGTVIGCMTVLAPSCKRYISLIPALRGPEPVRKKPALTLAAILGGAQDVFDAFREQWGVETLSEDPQPPTSGSNETSVVALAQFDDYRVLFTGDVGPIGLVEAALHAQHLGLNHQPNLFQIPHQGSRHNVTPTALTCWLGPPLAAEGHITGRAVTSVGTNKPSHPRKKVTNALLRRGYKSQAARESGIRFSNFERPGWNRPADEIPFFADTREVDD